MKASSNKNSINEPNEYTHIITLVREKHILKSGVKA